MTGRTTRQTLPPEQGGDATRQSLVEAGLRLFGLKGYEGASIREIVHDRAFSGPDLSAVRVVCDVETTGHEHVRSLHEALRLAGLPIVD